MVWIGLVESVEGLKSKGWGFLQKQFRLQNVMQKSCLSVWPVAHLTKFRFASPTILWTHALKRISLFLSHPDWYRIQVREYFKAVLISLSNRLKPYRGQGKEQKKKNTIKLNGHLTLPIVLTFFEKNFNLWQVFQTNFITPTLRLLLPLVLRIERWNIVLLKYEFLIEFILLYNPDSS